MKLLAGWYLFWMKQCAVLLLFELDGDSWQRKHRVINVHSEEKRESKWNFEAVRGIECPTSRRQDDDDDDNGDDGDDYNYNYNYYSFYMSWILTRVYMTQT